MSAAGFGGIEGAIKRGVEEAFKRGFDAGVAHQKKADPPPKAKQLRDLLNEAVGALQDLHHHATWDADGELTQEEFDTLMNAAEQALLKAAKVKR